MFIRSPKTQIIYLDFDAAFSKLFHGTYFKIVRIKYNNQMLFSFYCGQTLFLFLCGDFYQINTTFQHYSHSVAISNQVNDTLLCKERVFLFSSGGILLWKKSWFFQMPIQKLETRCILENSILYTQLSPDLAINGRDHDIPHHLYVFIWN